MTNLCRSLIFFVATIALTAQQSLASEDDTIAQYSERAVELLRDAISRETAHGRGLVPAYAESLRQVFLEAGFAPEALTIVPYGETASLVVRYEGDGSGGRRGRAGRGRRALCRAGRRALGAHQPERRRAVNRARRERAAR